MTSKFSKDVLKSDFVVAMVALESLNYYHLNSSDEEFEEVDDYC